MRFLPAVLIALAATTAAAQTTCDAHTYGAKGDGKTNDTAAIQKAINTCAPKHGTVVLKGGTFVSAPLTLKSDLTLSIAEGSELLGSRNLDDYPIREDAKWRRVALLHADHVSNLRITGGGVIDGSGDMFWELAHTHRIAGDTSGSGGFPRPMLLDITESQHLTFDHITLQNSPMYNFTFFFCDGIKIDHAIIRNPATGAPNTDGIDPFSSKNIEISNVDIDTGDDDIALKSGLVERDPKIGPVEHVYIHDSIFRHGHGLSVGSELAGGINDVRVENVTMEHTEAGVRIKSNRTRGNDIHDLHYKNITMTGVGQPIQITEYYPKWPAAGTDTAKPVDAHTPRFHDISLEGITATGAKDAIIIGIPEMPIRNLTLTNVKIESEKGLQIRNADVTMKNVTITPKSGDPITKEEGANITRR
ncbi:glycoside hydrolase family 28 protein [Terriglobus sp. TAA 43]|uniref:glycoside hydrolase family 28 protein n=1 Tax=Terriglobus sp. TAA 43 TaxID=278961 RepID=UPI0006456518|nr:glycosyl hydrolase family 28 protein [Terriglobus sp. TAA 43]